MLRLVDEHLERFEPAAVTLPWRIPSGEPTTVRLLLTDEGGRPMWRNRFNDRIWNPARRAAGVVKPTRQDGTHALRHHYASVLLDAGESVKALSEYLGHHDAGFTVRTYTHSCPTAASRLGGRSIACSAAQGTTTARTRPRTVRGGSDLRREL